MPDGADALLPVTQPPGGPRSAAPRARLPFGVRVLAIFQFVLGAYWLAALDGFHVGLQAGMPEELLAFGEPGRITVAVFGAVRILAALGLLLRLRPAWILVMLMTGIGLAFSISGYAIGRPDDLRLLFEVASAFYLNQPVVRRAFGIGRPTDGADE